MPVQIQQSRLRRNYGRVAEEEFQRYGSRLHFMRAVLSAILLLPISLILVVIPPLAIFAITIWFRVFSLNHKHFSNLERSILTIVTITVAIITTISFFQSELVAFNRFFNASYGFGLLTGLVLLFTIILKR